MCLDVGYGLRKGVKILGSQGFYFVPPKFGLSKITIKLQSVGIRGSPKDQFAGSPQFITYFTISRVVEYDTIRPLYMFSPIGGLGHKTIAILTARAMSNISPQRETNNILLPIWALFFRRFAEGSSLLSFSIIYVCLQPVQLCSNSYGYLIKTNFVIR